MNERLVVKRSDELLLAASTVDSCEATVPEVNSNNVLNVLNKFNADVVTVFSNWLGGSRENKFVMRTNVSTLSVKERDELDAIMIDYGHWLIVSGDHFNFNYSPLKLYKEAEVKEFKELFMINSGRLCIKCHMLSELKKDGHWECPQCGDRVGTYKDTDIALGSLASDSLRKARIRAHKIFDKLWQEGGIERNTAYAELSKLLHVNPSYAHIGMLNTRQCDIAVQWASAWWKDICNNKQKGNVE